MRQFIRGLIPNWIVNYFKHLPTAVLANLKYGFPSRSMVVIGVTGTDGKTTTVNMIYQILKQAGKRVSMVSTVNAMINGKSFDTGFHVTSPAPMDLQRYMKMAKNEGSEYLVLEVSSSALAQFRVWGVRFEIGVVTNITQDHLDYHKSWENYFLSKAKLIRNSRVAILNHDERHYQRLKKIAKGKVVSFGLSEQADFNPQSFPLVLRVFGEYNKLNALAASAVAVNLGFEKKVVQEALNRFENVKGRMNEVKNKRGIKIYIDYAHTPNGLEQALRALKENNKGKRIIAVIGAEGYRDVDKRAGMGEVATRYASKIVVTAVDPRGMIDEINEQILDGVKRNKQFSLDNVVIENDRVKAVDIAINQLAGKGDIVGIFGKGHETGMNLDGKREIPWSESKVVEEALKKGLYD